MAGKRIVTLLREVAAGLRGLGHHRLASDFENSARGCTGGTREFNNDEQASDLILKVFGDQHNRAERLAAALREGAERIKAMERALLVVAPQHQGGNGASGVAICNVLGISHPITMDALFDYAEERGMEPLELWPWATQTAESRKK